MCNARCIERLHALPAWWEGARNIREDHAMSCTSEEQRDHHLVIASAYDERRKQAMGLPAVLSPVKAQVIPIRGGA